MLRACSLVFALLIAGCQFAQRRAMDLLEDRVQKLKPLSQWQPLWCDLEVKLTAPAVEHYKTMYPKEVETLSKPSWPFTWKAREANCEVTALLSGEAVSTQKGLLDTALCTLLQVHWVNSPFDELQVAPEQVDLSDNQVRIKTSSNPELGIFLPTDQFVVETKTKSRGNFRASYSLVDQDWLPKRIEVKTEKTILALDEIEFSESRISGRRSIKSAWLELGEDTSLRQAQINFGNCQPF